MTNQLPRLSIISMVLVAICGGTVNGQVPTNPLVLVPNDYSFCVVANDLRTVLSEKHQPKNLRQFVDSSAVKLALSAPEFQKFLDLKKTVLEQLNVSEEEAIEKVFSERFALVYRKGPLSRPNDEDAMLIANCRDWALAARVLERLNEVQIKSGDLESVAKIGTGNDAYTLRYRDKKVVGAYTLRDGVVLFSKNEKLLVETLAKFNSGTRESHTSRQFTQLGLEPSPLVLMLNPRSFDEEMQESEKNAKGSEQSFVREFRRYWQSAESLACFFDPSRSFDLGIAINFKKDSLAAASSRFWSEFAKKSPLWSSVPDNSLLAVVLRIDPRTAGESFKGFVEPQDRSRIESTIADGLRPFLEKDSISSFVDGFGPEWGFWIQPPSNKDKAWFPQPMFAVKINRDADGAVSRRVASSGLEFLARLACLSDRNFRLQTVKQGDVVITSLLNTSMFPEGFQPSFAIKGDYLLIGGSAGALEQFKSPVGEATDADEIPIARLSIAGWRAFLKTHGDSIVNFISKKNDGDAKVAKERITAILPLLEGFEKIELVQRPSKDRIAIVIRIHNSQK